MKITNRFVLLGEMDLGASSGFLVKFRENVCLDLRIAGWASAGLPCGEEIDRERPGAVRTGEMSGHLAKEERRRN
jgi:hypothetical protein